MQTIVKTVKNRLIVFINVKNRLIILKNAKYQFIILEHAKNRLIIKLQNYSEIFLKFFLECWIRILPLESMINLLERMPVHTRDHKSSQ